MFDHVSWSALVVEQGLKASLVYAVSHWDSHLHSFPNHRLFLENLSLNGGLLLDLGSAPVPEEPEKTGFFPPSGFKTFP